MRRATHDGQKPRRCAYSERRRRRKVRAVLSLELPSPAPHPAGTSAKATPPRTPPFREGLGRVFPLRAQHLVQHRLLGAAPSIAVPASVGVGEASNGNGGHRASSRDGARRCPPSPSARRHPHRLIARPAFNGTVSVFELSRDGREQNQAINPDHSALAATARAPRATVWHCVDGVAAACAEESPCNPDTESSSWHASSNGLCSRSRS